MYVTLRERLHAASDIASRDEYVDAVALDTLKDEPENVAKLRERRDRYVADGRDVWLAYTAVSPGDVRFGTNRKQRRAMNRVISRFVKGIRRSRGQEEVDGEVDRLFDEKDEKRTESGLELPK